MRVSQDAQNMKQSNTSWGLHSAYVYEFTRSRPNFEDLMIGSLFRTNIERAKLALRRKPSCAMDPRGGYYSDPNR